MPTECPHGVILDWGDFGEGGDECSICDDANEAGFARDILDALTAYGHGVDDNKGAAALFIARHVRSANGGPT